MNNIIMFELYELSLLDVNCIILRAANNNNDNNRNVQSTLFSLSSLLFWN